MINGDDKNYKSLAEYFENISEDFGAIWLDSSYRFGDRGRYSFIATNPIDEIILENDTMKFYDKLENFIKISKPLVGYIGYEASLDFLEIQPKFTTKLIPYARFLVYDKLMVIDHQGEKIQNGYKQVDENKLSNVLEDISTLDYHWYQKQIEKIKYHITEGDIYQANFTHQFVLESKTKPFEVYKRLRELNPAPYSSFMNFGDYQIISSSPERMFKREGQYITSSPIKGTISRGNTEKETKENINKLLSSEKDKAELLMIVDLVRNDLGKIAKTGTVKVDNIYKTEVYSSLIHLVADISAQLDDDVTYYDIFKALLPGGSITGAPKKRAVEIINDLEASERSVYTGCIGYITGDNADFNIAIRTMVSKNNKYYLNSGGGIVIDSQVDLEYNELLLKAKNLFKALGG